MATPMQQLVELKLGEPVGPWIATRRAAGDSLVMVAAELVRTTGLAVSPETIRQWSATVPQ